MCLSGIKYSKDQYGFPLYVVGFMRNWFDSAEAGNPDKWGRKVWHVGFDGDRNLRIVIHLKACDR